MEKAIGYVRVSTVKQAESGLSIEAQRAAVRTRCEELGTVCVEIYEDCGVSGASSIAERRGLMDALQRARQEGATHLVVAKLDRLSRSPLILLTLEKEAKRTGLRITSVAGEGTEDDEPSSILVRRMLQAVAEHELALISGRTKSALAQKRERGEPVGRPPYGMAIVNGEMVAGEHYEMMCRALNIYRQGGISMRRLTEKMIEIDPHGGWNLKRVHSIITRWKTTQIGDIK